MLDRKSDRLDIMVQQGLSPECIRKITRLELREGIWGQVVQSGQAVAFNDKADVFKVTYLEGEKGEFHTCIILPLKSENKVQGTLALASYQSGKFQPDLVQLLQSMSEAIGIGVTNAIATQNLEEANELREQLLAKLISAQEEERKRIARELTSAIRAVYQGDVYLYPSIARMLVGDYLQRVKSGEEKTSYDGLTPREREILRYIAEGRHNREIAQLLLISVRTVQAHRSNLMEKLGAHDRTQLVKYAIRKGIISP